MFREGQYLEVIKTPDGCMATAIVTIKEKTVEYKNKAIKTNKWLDLQDWASVYGIIRKAIIRNNESKSSGKAETTERRKSIRQLEVTYKFEETESLEDRTSLPTIRVTVKSARRSSGDSAGAKSRGLTREVEKNDERSDSEVRKTKRSRKSRENKGLHPENYSLEEYVPPAISGCAKDTAGLKYVPSRKSALLRMRCSDNENKYTPTSGNNGRLTDASNDSHAEVSYIPNSIKSLTKLVPETYDPCCATVLAPDLSEAYVPSSKGARIAIEEYEPDFAVKTMKFDDSYVPSSTNLKARKEESRKRSRKSLETRSKKLSSRSDVSDITKDIAKRQP